MTRTEVDAGLPLLRTAADVAVEQSDDEALAYATRYLGLAHLFARRSRDSPRPVRTGAPMHVAMGSNTAAFALTDLAVTAMLSGDPVRAIEQYEQELAMTSGNGDPWTRHTPTGA